MRAAGIARVTHEINRAYCEAIGDFSQKPWADAPRWQKASVLAGVKFHIKNPQAGPEASHHQWLEYKRAEGWIYGEVKDDEKKTHPNMVPFAQLRVTQQIKDHLFKAIVHTLR